MRILFASGKGGAGKTTVTAGIAAFWPNPAVLADADVEAPDLGLYLPHAFAEETPVGLEVPVRVTDACDLCGECTSICQFNAIKKLGGRIMPFSDMCHGCGGCTAVCAPHAIVTGERELGRIGFGALEDGRIFLEGRSRVGEAMTPPLIRALLRKASACAAREKADLLIDAPPGVSCPVMTAAASADAVVLVIDPTPFGVHDFKLALRAFETLGKPMAAVINRSGQPSAAACEAELIAFCGEKACPSRPACPLIARPPHALPQDAIRCSTPRTGASACPKPLAPSAPFSREAIMHEIVVLSGKGGAGKTSVTAALARAMSAREKIVVCDYDVDAPDLHILLRPETEMSADFVSGHLAVFNSDNCIDCAQCLAFCRFDAIKQAAPCEYPVIEQLCEGCAVCVKLCPELAFDFVPRHCGEYYRSRTRFGTMIHAELTPGAENSGRLILLLKQEAAKAAQADGAEIILSDGTPGIGCPVISSLSGAALVCAVIEAGASGIADFKRLAELARRFRLPIAVIVNKADLSAEATEAAMQAARDAGAEVLGTLPFTPVFTEAMSRGEAVGETPSELDGHFQNFADRLLALVRGGRRSRIIPIKEKTS